MRAVGLMSGTSLDAIDAALVEIVPRGEGYAIELLHFHCEPYPDALRRALFDALPPNAGSVAAVARLHRDLGSVYARAARAAAATKAVGYVASHGQTLWHDGAAGLTLQLGDAFVIREEVGVTVCYDFRSADCAAGGHGAPLAAWADLMLFGDAREDRAVLNLGGIANVTLLRRGAARDGAIAFDTGPGNMLLDAFVRDRTHGERRYDAGGALAARGRVDSPLVEAMLGDSYFALAPPKTTGRERFGAHFLARYDERLRSLSLEDGAATLTEVTAASVASAIERCGFAPARLIVSGGGACNETLLTRLRARLNGVRVERSDAMGIPADAKEAILFALLGYETLRGRAANLPAATGAAHPAVLGAIAPVNLPALLAQIAAECAAA
ncbi:MAG TPA: anhydro-N-acetylmuramic acid kinase [Candidatus Nitrosotalea sp.]|nr:anhydro-N-acetylmuramic acid kinase [Candidatus Nitrosotalea sp.]